MMNAPTINAMRANTVRPTRRNPSCLLIASWFSFVIALPVITSYFLGRPAAAIVSAMSDLSCSWLTPGLATTLISPNWSTEFAIFCACGIVKSVMEAPARLSAVPNRAVPTIVYFCGRLVVSTVTRSPTFKLPTSAVWRSITISSARSGGRPVTRWNLLIFGFVTHPSPKVGGPFPPIAWPCLSTI